MLVLPSTWQTSLSALSSPRPVSLRTLTLRSLGIQCAPQNVSNSTPLPRTVRPCIKISHQARWCYASAAASPAEPSGGRQSDDEAPDPVVFGAKLRLEDVVHYINIIYFGVLLASIFTGNRQLTNIAAITNLINAMFLASAAFTGWSATRWIQDVRQHITATQRQKDLKALLRYGWSALFWAGFVLWYAVPPLEILTQWTGTAGAICCLYGITLAVFSALMVGTVS